MKKKFLCFMFAFSLTFSISTFASFSVSTAAEELTEAEFKINKTVSAKTKAESTTAITSESTTEEDMIDDAGWDQLEALGLVATENGVFTVSITLPADFVGEDITQEQLDDEVDINYLSATLNEDGSVTYKMTKKQHKAMMQAIAEEIDSGLQDLVDSEDYAFTEIKHNDDFSQFDAVLSTDEVGITESFMAYAFFLYSACYGCLTGATPDNIVVNYTNPNGDLIMTLNSADLENAGEEGGN